jgi:hypothetical protein
MNIIKTTSHAINAEAIGAELAAHIDRSDFEDSATDFDNYGEWRKDIFIKKAPCEIAGLDCTCDFELSYRYRRHKAKWQGDRLSPPDPDEIDIADIAVSSLDIYSTDPDFEIDLSDAELQEIYVATRKQLTINNVGAKGFCPYRT